MGIIEVWKAKGQIIEGIVNRIFKQEHIEEIALARRQLCEKCVYIGRTSAECLIPGTYPCCSQCGCCLELKTRSLSSSCPKGIWNEILTEEEEDKLNEIL
jgi:hypothetical protein